MKEYKRITVKIGSNVLTRKDGHINVTRMSALVDQIASLRKRGIEVIVVSSGAVACGASVLPSIELKHLDDVSRRQLLSAVGQVKLINRYFDLFNDHGLAMGQVLTVKENFSTPEHYQNQRNCMYVMLENDVIPIINENDTVSITELMFTDNDELSGLVAAMMDCDALIILSNIDGVYNGNPKEQSSQVIRRINAGEDFSRYIQAEKSGFGRGGMISKYRIASSVAKQGIDVIIANGMRDNILIDLIENPTETVSTLFTSEKSQDS